LVHKSAEAAADGASCIWRSPTGRRRRPSSSRRAPRPHSAPRPTGRRRSATATFRPSPGGDAAAGSEPPATAARWPTGTAGARP